MDDLSVLNRDDRDEPVVIGCCTRKNRAVHFVFENHDATIPGAVHHKCVAGVKLDRLAVSGEACHQIGASSYRRRPAGKGIARFEECVFGKTVEIVFAVNKSPQACQDDSEKGIESFNTSYRTFVINNSSASDGGIQARLMDCLLASFALYRITEASSKFSRGLRAWSFVGSP